MIQVVLSKAGNRILKVDVSGHAYSAEPGKDLVCAGVSSICIGALNALDTLCKEDCTLNMKNNRIQIQTETKSDTVQTCLKFLEIQLRTLMESYPQYIQITGKEV